MVVGVQTSNMYAPLSCLFFILTFFSIVSMVINVAVSPFVPTEKRIKWVEAEKFIASFLSPSPETHPSMEFYLNI